MTVQYKFGEVCEHGSLKRQCLVCELEDQINELIAENIRLKTALQGIKDTFTKWPAELQKIAEDALNDYQDGNSEQKARVRELEDILSRLLAVTAPYMDQASPTAKETMAEATEVLKRG